MPKFNLSTIVTNLDGSPVTNNGENLRVSDVAVGSLLSENPRAILTPEEKVENYNLANLIFNETEAGNEVSLTSEQIVVLKKRVGSFWSPLVVGFFFNFIES